ncbi:MAG: hypothetical protein HQL31_11045, partial [Planctomycetes bacterium]|nr:hypothetical protein [Planctomycetota bacterium]
RAIVFVVNRERDIEREVSLEIDLASLFPRAQGVAWRDLDPGLEPPREVAASAAEIKKIMADASGQSGLTGANAPVDDIAMMDELEGTTPEGRAQARFELRTDGNKARIVIRPRDYRVLEVRPTKGP